MPKLQFNFTSLPAKNFGVILPLTDEILTYSDAFDIWLPEATPQNMTIVNGRISQWIGRKNGHLLTHATDVRRPRPENGLIRFSSDIQTPEAQLDLVGAGSGVQNNFTMAGHFRIHPEQLGVDNQYIMGASPIGAMARLAYRFTNNTRYIRYQTNDNALNADVALPLDWNGICGVVVTITGLNVRIDLSTGATFSRALTVPFNLSAFYAAAAQSAAGAGSLRGYLGRIGLWNKALSDAERAKVLRWVA